jgi:hypothetical protein
MLRKLTLVSLILFNASVLADANDGEYLGFTLGQRFNVPKNSIRIEHITGAIVYVVDPGQHPHHIDTMSIYVSPESSVVGSVFGEWYFDSPRRAKVFADRYMARLQEKYPHWRKRGTSLTDGEYQLWVDVEEKPPIVEYWPSHRKVRVAIGLIYAHDSLGRLDWMALIKSELGLVEVAARD